jgi:NitT/TauT family transport system substrate-binding protein
MKMKLTSTVTLLMMILLALAGCSQPAKQPEVTKAPETAVAGNSQPAPTPQKTWETKIAPGPKGGLLYLSEMVAEGIGAFKEQGVNLTVLPTTGGNDAAKALMSGEADFAMLAFDHVLKNRAQGADLVVVTFLTKNPALTFIVQSDLQGKVKSIKDLKGQKIGVSSLGGGTHMAVLSLLKQAGMQPEEVEIVAAKDKLASMWANKEIAAAMHVDPQVTELVSAGKAFILADYRKTQDTQALYASDYPLGTLVTRAEVIQKNPELVQRVVTAVMAANKFIQTHSAAEVAAKVPADYTAGATYYDQMVAQNLEALSLSGTASDAGMNTVLKQLRENKIIPADADVDLAKAVDMGFVSKAGK